MRFWMAAVFVGVITLGIPVAPWGQGVTGVPDRPTTQESLQILRAIRDAADKEAMAAQDDTARVLRAYDKALVQFARHFTDWPPKKLSQEIVLYRDLVAQSESLVEKLLTEKFIVSVPFEDLLASKHRASGCWGASKAGIRYEFSGRELIVEGIPVEKRKLQGVLSVDGWTEPWWDYLVELEFEIVNGGFDLLLKYRPDGYKYYLLPVNPENGYSIGRSHRIRLTATGSTITLEHPDRPGRKFDKLDLAVSRNGGFALALSDGAKVIIREARVKVLR